MLFGITDEGYEVMARNMSDIMAHIEQQKAIIAAYKNYYEESEQAIDQANENQDAINNEIDKVNTQNEDSKPWWDITQYTSCSIRCLVGVARATSRRTSMGFKVHLPGRQILFSTRQISKAHSRASQRL